MTMNTHPAVIVGTGLAGYNLMKELRKLDSERPVLMITADDGSNYSKPMLSTGFARQKSAAELAIASAADMADQFNITVRTHTRITSIDPQRQIIFIDQEEVPYSQLVLAWGASVVPCELKGNASDHVYAINDLHDYDRFRQAADGKKRVLIMGAGLIGAEFANDLATAGFDIDIVAPCEHLMPGLLPAQAANAVESGLAELGVSFHFGSMVDSLSQSSRGLLATLNTGKQISTDLVVSAIGLRPRLDIAADAGLQVNRGIVVDRSLKTSVDNIYALGDCAEVDGHVLLYVLPLMASARALAKTLAGQPTEVKYGPMPVTVKTPVVPVTVSPVAANAAGNWQIDGKGRDIQAEYRDSAGKLLGYALTGDKVMNKVALNKELPALML